MPRNEQFTPELGQAFHGCPWGDYEAPDYAIAALEMIGQEIERVEGNRRQKVVPSPMRNAAESYANAVFEARAYYWGDDEALASAPNFRCGDVEVRWYKYLGRGTSVNRPTTPDEWADILRKCLASLRE